MPEPYTYRRAARSRAATLTLVGIWATLTLTYAIFDAAWWVIAVLAILTLPLLWDIIADHTAEMRLDIQGVHWRSGTRTGSVAWAQIRLVRLDTRLDFSTRMTLVPVHGPRIRIPFEATPQPAILERELAARGIALERHHFSLLG